MDASTRRLRALASALGGLALAIACTSGPPPPSDERPYAAQIVAYRAEKDFAFRNGADSPIPEAERASFTALTYYDIDPAFHTSAALTVERTGPDFVIELPTSTGDKRKMRRIGLLGFTVKGSQQTLSAFVEADDTSMTRLFVPFGDLTNGAGTYRGGRYIELDRTRTGLYDLDFNRAYNPFCVYNNTYDCPIPPKENRLAIAVTAGERASK